MSKERGAAHDASKIGYHPFTLGLLYGLVFSFMGTLLVFAPDFMRKYGPKGPQGKIGRYFAWYFFLGATLFTVIDSIATYNQYHTIQEAFKTGHYKVVEGNVSNFKPMLAYGHGKESFSVNDVSFSYSNNEITGGFNHVADWGGPIREGLYVRISYMEHKDITDNVIIKLEIKK